MVDVIGSDLANDIIQEQSWPTGSRKCEDCGQNINSEGECDCTGDLSIINNGIPVELL